MAAGIVEKAPALAADLARSFMARHPGDAARALTRLPVDQMMAVLAEQAPTSSAEVLRRLDPGDASEVIARLGASAWPILEALDPARAAQLLARLDPHERARILEHAPASLARELEALLAYPPDTAGSLMDVHTTAFLPETSVLQAFEKIRTLGSRRITDIAVIDDNGRLTGVVALQQLVGADPAISVGRLARPDPITAHPMMPREEVLELLDRHMLSSLPVCALDGRLVGMLRQDAIVRAAQQEAAADAQAMVGAGREERALSSVGQTVRSRLPWLQVNLFTAFIASAVVGAFESTLAQYTALAVLLPVVAGQSGNTGAQALAVTSRGLALREIRPRQWWRVVRKELAAGALNGLLVAFVTATGVLVWSHSAALAIVIGVAMVTSMILAAMSGALIPIALTAAGRDPATASSIVLTTITDVVGFVSFLGLATLSSGLL